MKVAIGVCVLVVLSTSAARAGLYRDETGRVIEIDDRFAEARGYTPLTSLEHAEINAQRGLEARAEQEGAEQRSRWTWAILSGLVGMGLLATLVHLNKRARRPPLEPSAHVAGEPGASRIQTSARDSANEAAVQAVPPDVIPACPRCDAPMSWAERFGKFHCATCRIYVSGSATPVHTSRADDLAASNTSVTTQRAPEDQSVAKPSTTETTASDIPVDVGDRVVAELGLKTPAEMLDAAQQRHFSKVFDEAKYLYTLVVDRHPTSDVLPSTPADGRSGRLIDGHRDDAGGRAWQGWSSGDHGDDDGDGSERDVVVLGLVGVFVG